MPLNVLVVDDDKNTRESLAACLKDDGYEPVLAEDGAKAIRIMREEIIDVVVSDVRMEKGSGFDVLDFVRKSSPETAVIMITAFGDIPSAVDAVKRGAYDYLTKPIDIEKLNLIIQKAVKSQRLLSENIRLKQQLKERFALSSIIGKSAKIQKVLADIERIAPTDATVLISGETGAGKELVAKAIHYNSPRFHRPLLKVDCSALAEGIIESELFGHEKGAFTGAWRQKRGRFELAEGGTLFLDEIGDLSRLTQVKLLRLLQDQEFERVGSTQTIKVNVRLVAASNKDLKKEIEEGLFREDLYYRLKVVSIDLPPLRERVEDITLLASYFLEQANERYHKEVKKFSPGAMNMMMRYTWPGNIRELKNCIEGLVIMSSKDTIDLEDLPAPIKQVEDKESVTLSLGSPMRELEKQAILKTLAMVKGNKHRAAQLLGIGIKTLYRRLNEYGLTD